MRRLVLVVVLMTAATVVLAQHDPSEYTLENSALAVSWHIDRSGIRPVALQDKLAHRRQSIGQDAFTFTLKDGSVLRSSAMRAAVGPKAETVARAASSPRKSDQLGGREIVAQLDAAHGISVHWRAILGEDAQYVRQEVTVKATTEDVSISKVTLINLAADDVKVVGSVKGSPAVSDSEFYGFEHPLSKCETSGTTLTCSITRDLPLRKGQSVTYSSVVGVTHSGQLRREFLAYVERERAHPYRTFLHYNSWYDLGYFQPYDDAGAVDRINAFGTQLTTKRAAKLDSFLFDDGWDDPNTLWHFNAGFRDGFTGVREAAAKYSAAPGIWLSPWGGYDGPKEKRVKAAAARGFETIAGGFALSGPKYFAYFRQTTSDFIRRYGINQFKFDGTGNADRVIPGSEFDSDFDAMISLIHDLRRQEPNLYVNLTTGTYPSPFWLWYADSTWRGGEDHSFAGVGSDRERWITYRDAATYEHVVKAGPLYPLNSLMLHGIIYARYAEKLGTDPQHDFANEVRDYFGTGTQLQEMYVTPSLLTQADWDVLAEQAKWSRENASTLVDTHWIGGDPAKLEVYGWAAWSPEKGIVTLRNPSDKPQTFALDIAKALELPADAPQKYAAMVQWRSEEAPKQMSAGEFVKVELQPFEVWRVELKPER